MESDDAPAANPLKPTHDQFPFAAPGSRYRYAGSLAEPALSRIQEFSMNDHHAASSDNSDDTTTMELVICHDYESGTTVEGTTRGSDAHRTLHQHPSWVWSRYAQAWLLRSSRHREPKTTKIEEIERVLIAAGYQLSRQIDPSMPSVAEQEADRGARMRNRSERLTARAARVQAQADGRRAAADAVLDNIPLGQPYLTDHYSYRGDRRRRERAFANHRKAIEGDREAARLREGAASTDAHMEARNSPETVGNRIENLRAARARLQRELDGQPGWITAPAQDGIPEHRWGIRRPTARRADSLRAQIATAQQGLEHWQQVLTSLQTEGRMPALGPATVNVGDLVSYRGMVLPVRRVNPKSVTVPNPNFPAPPPGVREQTWTIPYYKITAHRAAS